MMPIEKWKTTFGLLMSTASNEQLAVVANHPLVKQVAVAQAMEQLAEEDECTDAAFSKWAWSAQAWNIVRRIMKLCPTMAQACMRQAEIQQVALMLLGEKTEGIVDTNSEEGGNTKVLPHATP